MINDNWFLRCYKGIDDNILIQQFPTNWWVYNWINSNNSIEDALISSINNLKYIRRPYFKWEWTKFYVLNIDWVDNLFQYKKASDWKYYYISICWIFWYWSNDWVCNSSDLDNFQKNVTNRNIVSKHWWNYNWKWYYIENWQLKKTTNNISVSWLISWKELYKIFNITYTAFTSNFWWINNWQKNLWVVIWWNYFQWINNYLDNNVYASRNYDLYSFGSTNSPSNYRAILIQSRILSFPIWLKNIKFKNIYEPEVVFANWFTYFKLNSNWNNLILKDTSRSFYNIYKKSSGQFYQWFNWTPMWIRTSIKTIANKIKWKLVSVKELWQIENSADKQYYFWNYDSSLSESKLKNQAYNWNLWDIIWVNYNFNENYVDTNWDNLKKLWKVFFKIDNR